MMINGYLNRQTTTGQGMDATPEPNTEAQTTNAPTSVELGNRAAGEGVRVGVLDDRAHIEGSVQRNGRTVNFTYHLSKSDVRLLSDFFSQMEVSV